MPSRAVPKMRPPSNKSLRVFLPRIDLSTSDSVDKENPLREYSNNSAADPVVSTRYPAELIEWMCKETGLSRAHVLRNALDVYIAQLRRGNG